MITLPEVQGAWFFFYRKGDVIMEELDILRYNDFKSFQSITEGNLSLQSEKTKNLYCAGGLRRLWLLCECLPYGRGSDHERHYGAGEYGQMRRLREVPTGVIEIREVGA